MFDTIMGNSNIAHYNTKKIQPLLNKMQSSTINYNVGTKTYSGNVENIRIKINEHSIRFDGSLSKFYLGNNIEALTVDTTKLAISKLSDVLGLSIQDASINRLDFAQNLSLSNPAVSYYPLFGESKYLQRLEQGHGLYYRNIRRELVFYDKNRDVRKSKTYIDPKFTSQKLLRFEVRLKGYKHICKYFNIPSLTMKKLSDPDFYKKVIIAWGQEYEKIEKYNDMPVFIDETYRHPTRFVNQLIYRGIMAIGGRQRVVEFIKQAKRRGVFKTDQQYYALQRKIRALNAIKDMTTKNDLIIEVNSKVKDFVLYNLQ